MISPNLLADARSFLFVPGNRPERFGKAASSGADVIVLDLEDAVPLANKADARTAIAAAWPELHNSGVPLVIRVNAVNQPMGQDDLDWMARLSAPAGVMVPKVESAGTLDDVRELLPGIHILPLIESAAGWSTLSQIAACAGVLRLVVGHIDFMADTGLRCSDDEVELAPLRFAVAMATRIHHLASAVDGVTLEIHNDAKLRHDTQRTQRFGFGAKLCIHPRQIQIVHEMLSPTEAEVDWARRVLAADANSAGAALQLDGRMIDLPVVIQASKLLVRDQIHKHPRQ